MVHPFQKSFYTAQQHLELLRARGLQIDDESKAIDYITNIGYFRLSAYFYPLLQMPKENHRYKAGSNFKQVMEMYRFDRKLRLLLFNEIEKIEIAIRSAIVNITAQELNNPFWMTTLASYFDADKYATALQLIDKEYQKSKEDFILHFKQTYSESYPPAWMIAEILPLGTLARIYMNLDSNQVKKKVAQKFGLQVPVFNSWIMMLSQIRNMCCHHTRMWNRELPVIPMEPRKHAYPWIDSTHVDKKRMYYRICIIRYFLFAISPENTLRQKLESLFELYPGVDIYAMGFPRQWKEEKLWGAINS